MKLFVCVCSVIILSELYVLKQKVSFQFLIYG